MESSYIGAPFGAIDTKITHSTQGIAVEIDAKRPRERDGLTGAPETPEEAARKSVEWALLAYGIAVEALAAQGLTPGPYKKAEGK